ncbi:MAG: hypothetical protein ABDH31_04150, partial [Chlorobiota bacterium]
MVKSWKICLLALLLVAPAATRDLPLRELAENPELYDEQSVSVVGTIANYRERVSRAGNPYTTFRLEEDGASVNVFAWGHQGLQSGQQVRVRGFTGVSSVCGSTPSTTR